MRGARGTSGKARAPQPSPTASTAKRASSAPPTHMAVFRPPSSRRLSFRAPASPAPSSRARSPAQSVLGEVSEGAVTSAPSDVLATEVGFNDTLVHLDRARRPLGDLLAVVQHEDGLTEPHDDLHVVLDEQHGLALVSEPAHGVEQVVEERAVHAGRRLVEQDQRGIPHEHANELHQLLLAIGQVSGELALEPLEFDEAQQLEGPLHGRRSVALGHHQEIFERRQLGEDTDHLEGATDALAGDLVGFEPVDRLTVEEHAPLVAPLEAGDAVEERRLARAVGADEAVDAAGLETQRDAVDGQDAAEALAQPPDLQRRRRHQMVLGNRYFICKMPSTPRGMRSTTATMIAPKRSWWR